MAPMHAWTVKDAMTQAVVTIDPGQTVQEAARRLAEHRISGAPVVAGDELIGIITEHDIVQAVLPPKPAEGGFSALDIVAHLENVHNRPSKRTVADVMSRLVVEVSPDTSLWDAAGEMQSRDIKRLPVVDGGRLVGIISRADIVRVVGGETNPQ